MVLIALLINPALPTNVLLVFLFACLALAAGISVLVKRPWTMELSAAEFDGMDTNPDFRRINTIISSVWVIIFAWFAVANWQELGDLWKWIPLAMGGVLSAVLPKFLQDRSLETAIAGDQRNNWPAPTFAASGNSNDDNCDVAVIGSGIGGLTAAALLADAGLKVAVFEHHTIPGGFAHNWLRKTKDPTTGERLVFRFDSGVHDVSGAHPGGPVDRVLSKLGVGSDVKWNQLDQRYILDGKQIDVPRDWRAYAAKLGEEFPAETDGIMRLFEDIHAIFQGMYSQVDLRSGIPAGPKTKEAALAFAKDHPLAVEWMDRPWVEFLEGRVTDKKAQQFLSVLALYITDDPAKLTVSAMAPIFGYYFNGGYYPTGGSGHLAKVLVDAIENNGGKVHLRTAVRAIKTKDQCASGLVVEDFRGEQRSINTTAIVSNVDVFKLADLVDDPAFKTTIESQTGGMNPACSAYGVHLGLRGTSDLPPIVHGETEAGPVYMVSPSTVDQSAAPEGYSTLELLNIIRNDDAKSWFDGSKPDHRETRDGAEYKARKEHLNDELVEAAKALIPDLEERIVFRTDSSPLTFSRYSWTSNGAIYGTQFDDKRMAAKTPIRNLVVAGAMTHGAGIEAVVISGALAAEALKPNLLD